MVGFAEIVSASVLDLAAFFKNFIKTVLTVFEF